MSPSHNILDLGLSDFNETWELQKKLQTKRILNEIEDHLLLVEHPPVYTLGKNAPKEHLLNFVNDASVIQTDRGGNITFHGPGQLVGYPILNLNNYKKNIAWFMRTLELILIQTLSTFKIVATQKEGLTGGWVDGKKIGAQGVRITRWVTMHGFSLNVNTDLKYFDNIIPCGIVDCEVTSMKELLGASQNMDLIKKEIVKVFCDTFISSSTINRAI